METALLERPRVTAPDLGPSRHRRDERPVGVGTPRRGRSRMLTVVVAIGALVGSVLLVGSVVAAEQRARARAGGASSTSACVSAVTLPCVSAGSDSEQDVRQSLMGVLGPPVEVTAASGELTGVAGEFAVKLVGPRIDWAYTGMAQNLAYLTVQSTGGQFAVVGIAGRRGGQLTVDGLLPGARVAHVRFWTMRYTKTFPVVASALHGQGFVGNSRLGRIENDTVTCLHAETLVIARCAFTQSSGSWLESPEGVFARTGQSITLDGDPGGDYVVAAKINEDGTVPALAPTGRDSAGYYVDQTLAGSCRIEDSLSAHNANGMRLLNFATLTVGTSSVPHPDEVSPVRVESVNGRTVAYYTGSGAALNDIDGTERDAYGFYLSGSDRCHHILQNGAVIPAAKRPNVLLGRVDTRSPIVWRGVLNNVRIAN